MPSGLSKSLKIDPLSRIDDEVSSGEDSQDASDLQLVCELPPVLETRASAQVVKAVGSALHRLVGFFKLTAHITKVNPQVDVDGCDLFECLHEFMFTRIYKLAEAA